LAFGNQALVTTSAPQTITVTNTGNLDLTGTFTFTGSTTFTQSGGSCVAALAAGATCTFNVVFRPTALGANSGSLAFAYTTAVTGQSAAGTGTPVSLTGTGVSAGPLAFVSATGATLANVGGAPTLIFTPTGARGPVTGIVTIRNNGPVGSIPVTITAESAAGINNTLFSLTGNTCPVPPATLARLATCTITIRYATPVAPPVSPNGRGLAAVSNNGSGTTGGSTNLQLVGR
jgi:hypothetical protein